MFQDKVKKFFDRKAKPDDFQWGGLVWKWDARHEDKHGEFEHLWKGPYQISEDHDNNSYILQEINGDPFPVGPVNGRFMRHYLA